MAKKSFIIQPTEVKNYDIVILIKQDIYDLEDCIELFQTITKDLKTANVKGGEINMVRSIKIIGKYIHIEDMIIESIEKLSKLASTKEMQKRMMSAIKQFNELSYGFQESWTSDHWHVYENIRSVNKKQPKSEISRVRSHQEMNNHISDLKSMAITINRLTRGQSSGYLPSDKDPFAMVDRECDKYKESFIQLRPKEQLCSCRNFLYHIFFE